MEKLNRIDSRTQTFMNSRSEDPLKKREQFAISLRRKKKDQIIKQKRIQLNNGIDK